MNFRRGVARALHMTSFCLRSQKMTYSNFIPFFQGVISTVLTGKENIFLCAHRNFSDNLAKDSGTNLKKRLTKKKKLQCETEKGFRIIAFSTAEEYNLENLLVGLTRYTTFRPTAFGSEFGKTVDVVHAVQNSSEPNAEPAEPQDIFFFREGSVVMWNMLDSEVKKVLSFLKEYEDSSFVNELIFNESESMNYIYCDVSKTHIAKDSLIFSSSNDILLEKYAVSNAMALSVHLGAYEANLEQYITTMEPVTEDLKAGVKIKMSRNEVLQKMGQLFALRHNINLNSDFLDTPDFYWDRDELEVLYQKMFSYFCINKRTKVINEKINHCIELVELLSSHVNDKHHVRLEWMIIILIMVEVGFEIIHYVDKYIKPEENNSFSA